MNKKEPTLINSYLLVRGYWGSYPGGILTLVYDTPSHKVSINDSLLYEMPTFLISSGVDDFGIPSTLYKLLVVVSLIVKREEKRAIINKKKKNKAQCYIFSI